MKDLVWDNSLSVDINEIDDDHRKLLNLFNILNHALKDGDAANYIEAVLEELISLTVWHFRHEERLMLKHGYDGFTEHQAEHQQLTESVRKLHKKFMQEGKTLSVDDLTFLEQWLTGHILGADMELGAYLGRVM